MCDTGIDKDTLELICQRYTQIPQLIFANKQFVQCCKEPFSKFISNTFLIFTTNHVVVDSKYAICGKNLTAGPLVIPAEDIPCHQVER